YTRLNDIVNFMWGLGGKIPETKICAKILCSLPEWFNSKVTAIQELRDMDNVRVEELVGSLQTYELNFKAPKGKSISLKTSKNGFQENDLNSDLENSEDDMALLAKTFYKIFKSKKRVDLKKSNDKKRSKFKT
ncbi:hypothetical protein PJI17_30890, partial [Mycobacterium kansasii]